ncbi:MAG: zinc-finger domain-containing protein [Alphaproteobacteria bacterium]
MLASQKTTDILISTAKIACDGDEDSGHPRVFLTVNAQGFVDCPYCGRHYVLKEGVSGTEEH